MIQHIILGVKSRSHTLLVLSLSFLCILIPTIHGDEGFLNYANNQVPQHPSPISCAHHDSKLDLSSKSVQWQLCRPNNDHDDNSSPSSSFLHHNHNYKETKNGERRIPSINMTSCFSAKAVPGTSLINLVWNQTFSPTIKEPNDLFVNDHLARYVPDIATVGKSFYTFYWITTFSISDILSLSSLNMDKLWTSSCEVRLNIRSLNYRGTVFINDREVLPDNNDNNDDDRRSVGMFHRWSYLLQGSNNNSNDNNHYYNNNKVVYLAILVEPPDFPGHAPNPPKQGGDHEIAKNAAMQQSTAGWDWIQGTPDRNTGLWDDISLIVTDCSFRIQHLHVHTITNIKSRYPDFVYIGIDFELIFDSTQESYLRWLLHQQQHNKLECGIVIKADVMESVETKSFHITLEDLLLSCESKHDCELKNSIYYFNQTMRMNHPKTWWPHNYGIPHLYHMTVTIQTSCTNNNKKEEKEKSSIQQTQTHAQQTVHFGLRTIKSYVDKEITNGRVFQCNGEKIFLQGGNWISTDMFHRFVTSKTRYQHEIAYHKEMGFNTIRVWGGGITERPEFYDTADEEGLLIIQEFWMTGDNNGRWAGSYDYPLNHKVYIHCAKDVILMLRNHPSLLLWVGGNELYPIGLSPSIDIWNVLTQLLNDLDPGRPYIASSMSNYTTPDYDPNVALAPKDGPYSYLSPSQFYERNPGLTFWNHTRADQLRIGFQPEIGSSATPIYTDVLRFIKGKYTQDFPQSNPINKYNEDAFTSEHAPEMMTYHNYLPYTNEKGWDHIQDVFGKPVDLREYCEFAQYAQYTQTKLLFEGFQRFMWTYYTAVLFWKSQSPWPSFRGFLYSWWLEPTGGYWGVKSALEGGQALHVQLGNWTHETSIVIINRASNSYPNCDFVLSLEWWDVTGVVLQKQEQIIHGHQLIENSVFEVKFDDNDDYDDDTKSYNADTLHFPFNTTYGVAYLRLMLRISSLSPNKRRTCDFIRQYGSHSHRNPLLDDTVCTFNEYLLSDPAKNQNFQDLMQWRQSRDSESRSILIDVVATCIDSGDSIRIDVQNPNQVIGLYVNAHLEDDDTDALLFKYSHQYFILLQGEKRQIMAQSLISEPVSTLISSSSSAQNSDKLRMVKIQGMNIRHQIVPCIKDIEISLS